MDYKKFPAEKAAAWVFLFCAVLVLMRLFFYNILLALLPFALAWGMAYLARPLALRLARYTRLPRGVLSVLLVLSFFVALCLSLFFAGRRAVMELSALSGRLEGETLENVFATLAEKWEQIITRFPFLAVLQGGEGMGEDILRAWLTSLGEQIGRFAVSAAGALATALPGVLFFLLVTVVGACYFAADLDGIHRAILSILPPRVAEGVRHMKAGAWQTAAGYTRAYLLLLLLTFMLLPIGFLLLRVPYALLLAALFALLDLLPIIGVGSLLIPWGIALLLFGRVPFGVGILALYAVIAVVRQFAEPRLLGRRLGMHPLLMLFSSYIGLKFFGFFGLMLIPAVMTVALRAFAEKGQEKQKLQP